MRGVYRATAAVLAVALAVVAMNAAAQAYPVKPIRMIVPFPAGGATDILGRMIGLYFTSPISAKAMVQAGRVRMVAQGGAKRSPTLPEPPTIAESGYPGFDVSSWWGVLGPAGIPKEIIVRLNHEVVKVMNTPEARERMAGTGADIVAGTPEQFADLIRSETAKWAKLTRELNIRME